MKKKLLLFASGSGSNAVNVCKHFQHRSDVEVVALFCNNPNAGVIEKMNEFEVPVVLFNRSQFNDPNYFLDLVRTYQPSLIALLGFLWKIPDFMVEAYPQRIVNLHPALLPKFGGKGMYGHFVHEAVKAAGEQETGITIHYVNAHYDEGTIIEQFTCPLSPSNSVEEISQYIHQLEQAHVPATIDKVFIGLNQD
jgi:phosphoribosylglycinamide formyltransferase-1